MSILEQVPPPTLYDGRSIIEINGKIEDGVSDVIVNDGDTVYPVISIDPDRIIKPSIANTRRSEAFAVNQRSVLGHFWSVYRSKGFVEGLKTIYVYSYGYGQSGSGQNYLITILIQLASFILFFVNKYSCAKNHFYPYNSWTNEELIQEFSPSADWRHGIVRCFKWHPKLAKCALALINDDIYIYSSISSSRTGALDNSTVPLLRHPLQKKVTDLDFSSRADNVLVVSTEKVIIIWTIVPDAKASRVSMNCARVIDANYFNNLASDALKEINFNSASLFIKSFADYLETPSMIKTPITSVTFIGVKILACSPNDSRILSLDAKTDASAVKPTDAKKNDDTIISSFGSRLRHGFARLILSPDGKRACCIKTSNSVRVYETINWSYQDWTLPQTSENSWRLSNLNPFSNLSTPASRDAVQSAVWSYNGRYLLVAFKNDPSVYTLTFYGDAEANSVGGSDHLIKILDVNEYELPNGNIVGGSVSTLAWDANSERLIISFKDNQEFIAVFKTLIKPTLNITPVGYIHGVYGERPLLVSFHDAFGRQEKDATQRKRGSLLSVVWSSGVVSNIPFNYTPSTGRVNVSVLSPSASSTPRSLTKICNIAPSPNQTNISASGNLASPLSPINRLNKTPNINYSILASDSLISPRKPTLFTESISLLKENM